MKTKGLRLTSVLTATFAALCGSAACEDPFDTGECLGILVDCGDPEPVPCTSFTPYCGDADILYDRCVRSGYSDRPVETHCAPTVFPSSDWYECVDPAGGPPACVRTGFAAACYVAGEQYCDRDLLMECSEEGRLVYIADCHKPSLGTSCREPAPGRALCGYSGSAPCDRPDEAPFACDGLSVLACDTASGYTKPVDDCLYDAPCGIDDDGIASCGG
jgi:hypothetical protein